MPNNLPNFLHIEASSPEEDAYPVCVSWSLEDGSIKSVLVMPDEDWDPWDNCLPDTDVQLLLDQGVSGPDIIRELNEDLDGKTVFVAGFDYEEESVNKLFDTYSFEPGFEIATLSNLFAQMDLDEVLSLRSEVANENNLQLDISEDIVRAHVFMAHDHL